MKFQTSIQNIWIDPVPHEKLSAWTRMAKGEVSALGLIEDAQTGPVITDVFLVKQTCTGASTDMDQADIATLMFDLAAAGQEARLRAWIHSHANMDVFWSKTDDDTIEGMQADPYFVSLVVNKRGDVRGRIDLFRPLRVIIDDVPVKVRMPDLGLEAECRAEFNAKVDEAPLFPAFGLPINGQQHLMAGFPDTDLFGTRSHRPFAMLDLEEMEEAVRRGEMTVQEYIEATEGDAFIDPFVDAATQEVADGRHP